MLSVEAILYGILKTAAKNMQVPPMSNEKEMVYYINEKWYPASQAKIPLTDQGFQYADGVFEGIMVYDGMIFKLDEHLDRLFRSMRVMKIESSLVKEDLKNLAVEFVKRNNLRDGHFKIVVTRGEGYFPLGNARALKEAKPTVAIFGILFSNMYEEKKEKGIRLKTVSLRSRPHECLDPRIKCLSYTANMLCRIEAYASGADDALMLDLRGFVSEASVANFFIVTEGKIRTSRGWSILEGITRGTVIDLAITAGYTVVEEDMNLYDVYTADEAFICGSATEIVPVVEVDGRKIGGPGPITNKLQELYKEMTHKEGPWVTKAL